MQEIVLRRLTYSLLLHWRKILTLPVLLWSKFSSLCGSISARLLGQVKNTYEKRVISYRSLYGLIYTIGIPSLVSAFWDLYHSQEGSPFHSCAEQLMVRRWPAPGPGFYTWTREVPRTFCVHISLHFSVLAVCCCLEQQFCQIHHCSKCSKTRNSTSCGFFFVLANNIDIFIPQAARKVTLGSFMSLLLQLPTCQDTHLRYIFPSHFPQCQPYFSAMSSPCCQPDSPDTYHQPLLSNKLLTQELLSNQLTQYSLKR